MSSRSTIHVTSVGDASDVQLSPTNEKFPSTALSEEYFSEDCHVGFFLARLTTMNRITLNAKHTIDLFVV